MGAMSEALPSGTVTLLFTDIEGSSALWDEHRSAMALALTRHNQMLADVIAAHDGHVVKDKGDGFFAAFASAESAIAACVEAQQAISSEEWPEPVRPLRVRMAVHTGTIEPDGGDYRGPVVNRVARLEGLAQGGQVLVSASTAALTADSMPAGTGIRDLGSHLLRGMARPERIYQLTAEGLADDFAPLPTDLGGVGLPSYPTSFVGRDSETHQISSLIASGQRLVTLLGPGGIGKTRLAIESARAAEDTVGGRVYFADLAPLANPEDVGQVIADAVGAHVEGAASPIALAAARLTESSLLVLDNFEHLQEAARTVAELLDATAHVKVIATSRAPLNVRGEKILHIEPLSTTNGDGSKPAALALLAERAASYGITFGDSEKDRRAAMDIVARLDGLPLAIELVAARTRVLGLPELAEMLRESLDALGTGSADTPDRQKTIRSTIEWSLDALTPAQRDLFTFASIFPAGATLDQLAAIDSDVPKTSILDDITALVDNSLINVITGLPGPTRYRQLVLMREYGLEQLHSAGTYDEAMGRLTDYYIAVAPELNSRMQSSDAPQKELSADFANLLGAMSWAVDSGRIEEMVDVVCTLWVFWFNGDLAKNAWEWVGAVDPILDTAKVDWLVGFMALQSGQGEVALTRLGKALARFEAAQDEEWIARTSSFLSFFTEDAEEGRALAQRALDYFSQHEPGVDLFLARLMESAYHFRIGDFATAVELRRHVLEWANSADFGTMIAWAHWNLGIALLAAGEVEEAREHNLASAERMIVEGYQEGIASSADIEAAIRIMQGDTAGGLRILGASQIVWERIGTAQWPEAAMLVERAMEIAGAELGVEYVAQLINEGRRIDLDQLSALLRS